MHPGRLIGRAAVAVALAAAMSVVAACSALTLAPSEGPLPTPDPECLDASYDFVGEATLAQLGLENATPGVLPHVDWPAQIRVTHAEFATPHFGGSARMLCFQFLDGSGGSEWPVHPGWRPPHVAGSPESAGDGPPILLIAVGGLFVIAVSAIAFRRSGAR